MTIFTQIVVIHSTRKTQVHKFPPILSNIYLQLQPMTNGFENCKLWPHKSEFPMLQQGHRNRMCKIYIRNMLCRMYTYSILVSLGNFGIVVKRAWIHRTVFWEHVQPLGQYKPNDCPINVIAINKIARMFIFLLLNLLSLFSSVRFWFWLVSDPFYWLFSVNETFNGKGIC